MKYRKALGNVLYDLREQALWSLADLAERSGISRSYLWEIERGKKEVSSELLAELAFAFGISLSGLVQLVSDELR